MSYVDELRQQGWDIGCDVVIEEGVVLKAEYGCIGSNSHIGKNVRIVAPKINIGKNCLFYTGVDVQVTSDLSIGDRGKISRNTRIRAYSINIGHDFWCNEQVEIGGGGWQKDTAILRVGNFVHLGKGASVNVCCPVTVGSYSGIGIGCQIFTHSSGNGQSILEGYKHTEAPVYIGNHVSLFTQDIVAPGTRLEDYVTVATMSFICGSTEARGFYAGSPAVLKKKSVPLEMADWYTTLRSALNEEIGEDLVLKSDECTDLKRTVFYYDGTEMNIPSLQDDSFELIVISSAGCPDIASAVVFDINNMLVSGKKTERSERVRNALRRNGILFEFSKDYEPDLLSYSNLVENGIEGL